MVAIVDKIIRGDRNLRKTRFHDEKGNFVGAAGAMNAPRAFAEAVLRVTAGYRPQIPWLTYQSIPLLERIIKPEFRMVEFGSGMSTIWFAKRCQFVLSREGHEGWHQHVASILSKAGADHVKYEFKTGSEYSDLSEYEDGYFDFGLVDGETRAECMKNLIPKVKAGGWIYLDDSDKCANVPDGDERRAENMLLEAVSKRGGDVQYFTDFAPTCLFAKQGMLASLRT